MYIYVIIVSEGEDSNDGNWNLEFSEGVVLK